MSFLSEARRAKPKIDSSGKLCCDESESTMPSSVAAAWSSKSNVRQKRFLSVCPHARLMRPPERRVNHELHAARLVEKPLGHDFTLRGRAPQHPHGLAHVINKLRRACGAKPAFGAHPPDRLGRLIDTPRQLTPERGDGFREFRRARGRLAQPEGDVGRKPLRVLHAHLAALPRA